jgi:lathosterol oxidase
VGTPPTDRDPRDRAVLDALFRRAFGDDDPEALGSGWWSGVIGVFCGFLALGAVLCLHFPELLTSTELRALYPMPLVRGLIQGVIVVGFTAGVVSGLRRRRKTLAAAAVGLSLGAALLGGSRVPIEGPVEGELYLGLDWFLLNLLLLGLLFVPLERAFPLRPAQSTFRPGWTTDVMHLVVSHVGVQALTLATVAPATVLFAWAIHPPLQRAIQSQPLALQVVVVLLVTDLSQYAIHRLFHAVPALWRFHAVHHSSPAMDWLAAPRVHLVEILVTRGLSFVPVFVLGFHATAVYAYLLFVSVHAIFIHANLRWNLRWLEPFLVTPRIHHWHHASALVARDRNFAVHLPILDRLFGTAYLPATAWPEGYGVDDRGHPDGGYLEQFVYPFRPSRGGPDA